MRINKVTAGQSILPELRASTWNAFIDAAIHASTHRDPGQRRNQAGDQVPANTVLVRNDSGAAVKMFGVLGINGPAYPPADDENWFKFNPTLSGSTPGTDELGTPTSHHGRFVIAAAPIPDGGIGEAYVAGMTICRLNEVEGLFDRADAADGDVDALEVTPNGTAQVLWTTTTDEARSDLTTQNGYTLITQGGDRFGDHVSHVWAMVRLGVPCDVSYVGKTDEEIAADGTGTVSLWMAGQDTGTNVEAELDWMHGDEAVSSGKEVIVTWFAQEEVWRVTAAECED